LTAGSAVGRAEKAARAAARYAHGTGPWGPGPSSTTASPAPTRNGALFYFRPGPWPDRRAACLPQGSGHMAVSSPGTARRVSWSWAAAIHRMPSATPTAGFAIGFSGSSVEHFLAGAKQLEAGWDRRRRGRSRRRHL